VCERGVQFLRMQTDVVLDPTSPAKRLHDLKVRMTVPVHSA
jgi:hypothetical protein